MPLRPDLARPVPRPHATNDSTRPETQSNPRPNPRRPETGLTRPVRTVSRHPPARPVSPYTDWSSLSDNDVISVHSDGSDANYVPRFPVYEPDSPGPVQKRENWVTTTGEGEPEEQQSRTVVSNIFDYRNRTGDRDAIDTNERPRSPLGRGTLPHRGFPLSSGELDKEEGIILAR